LKFLGSPSNNEQSENQACRQANECSFRTGRYNKAYWQMRVAADNVPKYGESAMDKGTK
jgi:hypothetical protein